MSTLHDRGQGPDQIDPAFDRILYRGAGGVLYSRETDRPATDEELVAGYGVANRLAFVGWTANAGGEDIWVETIWDEEPTGRLADVPERLDGCVTAPLAGGAVTLWLGRRGIPTGLTIDAPPLRSVTFRERVIGRALEDARRALDQQMEYAREAALRAAKLGRPEAAVARDLGVDRMTVRKWVGK